MRVRLLLILSTILINIGILLLLHRVYYNLHHYSNKVEKIKENTLIEVFMEVIIGFIYCLVSRIIAIGPFLVLDISAASSSKLKLVAPAYRIRDFDIFNNRRKYFL